MREIVLDTETTGLDPKLGHRIVEIGCVELVNQFPTGRSGHFYINPERDMPAEAFAVHGLSAEFLADKPCFSAIVDEFLGFVEEARLIIHNAAFDMAFINSEFERCGRPAIGPDRVLDTLMLARRRHPGAPCSLDDLCRRYSIDNSRRTQHGALLDAELLAEVYIELIGGRQGRLVLPDAGLPAGPIAAEVARPRPEPLEILITEDELRAHEAFVAGLGENAIWNRYRQARPASH